MPEIPEVYGVWEPPACCGDPGDCAEPCGYGPDEPAWIAPVKLMTRAEIELAYGAGIRRPACT